MNNQYMSEYILILFQDQNTIQGLSESDIRLISETLGYKAFFLKKELKMLKLALKKAFFFHNCSCGHNLFRFNAKSIGVTKARGKIIKWYNCKYCDSSFIKTRKIK